MSTTKSWSHGTLRESEVSTSASSAASSMTWRDHHQIASARTWMISWPTFYSSLLTENSLTSSRSPTALLHSTMTIRDTVASTCWSTPSLEDAVESIKMTASHWPYSTICSWRTWSLDLAHSVCSEMPSDNSLFKSMLTCSTKKCFRLVRTSALSLRTLSTFEWS